MAAHTGAGRAALLESAYRQMARYGYAGATTSAICAAAGVSSGTFFHFFPTKTAVVVALLEQDVSEAAERSAAIAGLAATQPRAALRRWVDHTAEDAADPDFAGFVSAVGTLANEPDVADALARGAAIARAGVATIVDRGRDHGVWPEASTDAATWVAALGDGYLARAAEDASFAPREHADALFAACERLLR